VWRVKGVHGAQADRIVLAKLTRPAVRGVLPRERLFTVLDGAGAPGQGAGGAVWVSGPAGSGKTTLVASHLEARGTPHLWLRVDEGDGDPATFFHYLSLAARRAAPRRRKPLPLLTPEYLPGLATFARRYLRELYGRLEAPFCLVLDNHQELPAGSPVRDLLPLAVEELPPGGRAVIVSREAPGPALAGLRAGRALAHLGADALRFTPGEAADLLALWAPGGADPAAAGRLQAKTQGWVAGMVLMRAQAAPGAGGPGSAAAPVTPETVYDYFAAEVLPHARGPVRELLAATAVLPEMTAAMAETLSGNPEAGAILKDLTRRNFFVERHPGPEPVYRYHALFREFLLERAAENLGADALAALRRRAARLLVETGRTEEAVEPLAAAEAWDELAHLIAWSAPALAAQARFATLAGWLALLPRERVAADPRLLMWRGVSGLPMDPEGVRPDLEAAWEGFRAAGDHDGCLAVWPVLIDTFQYAWGDFHPLTRWVRELEALLGPAPDFPSPEVEARVALGMVNALFLHCPDHPAGDAWQERLERAMNLLDDPSQRLVMGARLAQVQTTTGDLRKGERLLDDLAPEARSTRVSPVAAVIYHCVRATLAWIIGRPDDCDRFAERALALARETGLLVFEYIILAQATYGRLTAGDTAGAGKRIERMRPLLVPSRRVDGALFRYLEAWKAMLEGDLPAAREHARTSLGHAAAAAMPLAEGLSNLALGQVLQALDQPEAARTHLTRGHRIARTSRNEHMRFMALLALADFALHRGAEEEADARLREAMALGRERGYANFATWQPDVMARLCARALGAGIEPDYVRDLIRLRGLAPPKPRPLAAGAWPWPVAVRVLGPFEVAVDGRPVRPPRKAQKRPLGLLAALVAGGPEGVPEHHVADLLWPEAAGDAAQSALGTTLHRLRRLLGDERAVWRRAGRVGLDGGVCWVDAWAFEGLLEAAASGPPDAAERRQAQALALYRGPALAEADLPDAVPFRERLRDKLVHHVLAAGAARERLGNAAGACDDYRRGLAVEPGAEALHMALMRCHAAGGRAAEAVAAYHRLRETLAATQGERPGPEAEALYTRLRRGADAPPAPDP